MYTVYAMVNGKVLATDKRFSSLKNVDKYISKKLEYSGFEIEREYDSIWGHELVSDYHTRFIVNQVTNN